MGETFKWVTNPDIGLTAHHTPRGDSEGLFVASLTTTELVVRELQSGRSDVQFDYLVYGLRIGFEEQSIVQEKGEEGYIPSMKDHRDLYTKQPELRRYNAMERFRVMQAAVGDEEPVDLNASQTLRDAIEEYDPAVHGPVGGEVVRQRSVLIEEERRRLEERRSGPGASQRCITGATRR